MKFAYFFRFKPNLKNQTTQISSTILKKHLAPNLNFAEHTHTHTHTHKTTWKNIYVTYMSKYMKYIFAKSCIIRIYFAYIFWDIFAKIYLTYIIPRSSKYILIPKSCICRIYILFSWGKISKKKMFFYEEAKIINQFYIKNSLFEE